MAMTPAKVERQQELEQEKERIEKEINRIRGYLEELRVAEDGVDPDASERMMNLSIMENLERRLQSIDYALSVLQRGRYGICEDCGQPIEPERLKVLPDTTLCSKCKVERERTG
jgi:RNA polymerase-binding transcription factor DksA